MPATIQGGCRVIAKSDASAIFNGVRYQFKKGQQVVAPAPLIKALTRQGVIAPSKKKGNVND